MTVNEQIAYIEEKIFSLSEQVKKIKQDSLSPKTEFEKNVWYKGVDRRNGKVWIFKTIDGSNCIGFEGDFWNDRSWTIGDRSNWPHCDITLATESEVKEALIKEAEKRGFKEGVKLAPDSFFGHSLGITLSNKREFNYNIECDEFSILGGSSSGCKAEIYKQGKWATIVKEEAIKIGGYEVKFEQKYKTTWANVGCKSFSYGELVPIYDFMVTFGFKKIKLDEHETDLTTINAILEKLK